MGYNAGDRPEWINAMPRDMPLASKKLFSWNWMLGWYPNSFGWVSKKHWCYSNLKLCVLCPCNHWQRWNFGANFCVANQNHQNLRPCNNSDFAVNRGNPYLLLLKSPTKPYLFTHLGWLTAIVQSFHLPVEKNPETRGVKVAVGDLRTSWSNLFQ